MKRLFHIVWICLAVAACSKDELPGTHGEFASLTLIPIDLSQVELHLLSESEKQWLDEYHQQVREALSPRVDSDARPWLMEATAPIRVNG